MKNMKHIAVILMAGFGINSQAQLVPNGSFENGPLPASPANDGTTISAVTALPNWNISGSPLFYQYGPLGGPVIAIGGYYGASAGTNSVFLQAGFGGAKTPVSLWQNLSVPINALSVTFQSKSVYDTNLYPLGYLTLLVSVAGVSVNPTYLSTDLSGFKTFAIDVSSFAGSTMELKFGMDPLDSNDGGAWQIDNVRFSISAVPEPSTLTLLGLGAAALAFYQCRKKVGPSARAATRSEPGNEPDYF